MNPFHVHLTLIITIPGYSNQADWGVVEMGGYDGTLGYGLDRMEYSEDGETWEVIPTTIPGFQ